MIHSISTQMDSTANLRDLYHFRSVNQWSNYTKRSTGAHGKRGARACNGGVGAVPPVGSRGKAPGQGVRGQSPLELTSF